MLLGPRRCSEPAFGVPVDDILHKYEGMPQSAALQPAEKVIGSGQKMAIHLNQILDSYGEQAKKWQRVVVHVEKGKLNNNVPRREDYYYFEVGDGNIELQYEAPDECEDQTETVTVKNTCEIDPNQLPTDGRDEIAKAEFKIRCIRGSFEFTWEGTSKGQAGGTDATINYTESGEVPFNVEWKDGKGAFKAEDDVQGKNILTAYTAGGHVFKHTDTYTAKHLLKGEVLAPESDDPELKVYWERHISGEEIPQCEMIFPLRDGAEEEFPVHRSGPEGWTHDTTYTVTLHLDSED